MGYSTITSWFTSPGSPATRREVLQAPRHVRHWATRVLELEPRNRGKVQPFPGDYWWLFMPLVDVDGVDAIHTIDVDGVDVDVDVDVLNFEKCGKKIKSMLMGFTTVTQLMSCRYCVSLKYQTSPRLRFTMGSEVIAGTFAWIVDGILKLNPCWSSESYTLWSTNIAIENGHL